MAGHDDYWPYRALLKRLLELKTIDVERNYIPLITQMLDNMGRYCGVKIANGSWTLPK